MPPTSRSDCNNNKTNYTWKIVGTGISVVGILVLVMGMAFRLHAAQPHDTAVSETEFSVFLQQDIEHKRAVREDLREIRECMTRYLAGDSGSD